MKTTARTLLLAAALALPIAVAAGEGAFAVGKSDTVKSLLEAQAGKTVTVRLLGGEDLTGKVVSVGEELVHLKELAGKDFFDAAVRLSTISAVIVKLR